jgi:hypothetical protein
MGATGSTALPRTEQEARQRRSRVAVLVAAVPRLELTAMAVAAAVGVAWALWQPPVRDLAGHLFRIQQYDAVGLHVWNNLWYGGHLTPGYSMLFPPVAAAIGIGLTGVLSSTVGAGCFAALVHRFAGPAAWPGALWLAAATSTNLFTGRLVFALGAALGLGACLATQRGRPTLAAVLAIAAGATSPVAAAFVVLAGVALALAGDSPQRRRHGIVLAVAPALTVLVLSAAFPVQGDAQFGPVTLAACLLAGLSVWAAAPAAERVLRVGAVLYVAGCVVAFLVPTPLGGTAGRLAALVTGPLVLTLLLARRRAGTLPVPLTRPAGVAAVAVGVVVAAGWQWGAVRQDVHDAVAPAYAQSTREAFYAPLVKEVQRRSREPVRLEIPFTATHYEALWVGRRVAMARGWLRQLDRAHNPLFYDGRLTAARYGRWLRDNGVSWVALPAAPLDDSARAEARIIRSRPEYLRPVWHSPDWRLYRVGGSPGLISGPGRLLRLDEDGFVLEANRRGRILVRLRHNRYWSVASGDACVARAPDGWTALDVAEPGTVAITARLGSPARLGGQPQCPSAGGR